jgi:hypothetical protein
MKVNELIKIIWNKIACPTTSALIQIAVIYILFFSLPTKTNYYQLNHAENRIITSIKKYAALCGQNDYWSWLVVDEINARYAFKDVIGFDPNAPVNKTFSVKDAGLNAAYNSTHEIDDDTMLLLSKMQDGYIGYYNDVHDINKLSSINKAINSTNREIQSLGFTIVRDKENKLVYVFLASKTDFTTGCDRKLIVDALSEISLSAKGGLI